MLHATSAEGVRMSEPVLALIPGVVIVVGLCVLVVGLLGYAVYFLFFSKKL
jgi:hypothetical protein